MKLLLAAGMSLLLLSGCSSCGGWIEFSTTSGPATRVLDQQAVAGYPDLQRLLDQAIMDGEARQDDCFEPAHLRYNELEVVTQGYPHEVFGYRGHNFSVSYVTP